MSTRITHLSNARLNSVVSLQRVKDELTNIRRAELPDDEAVDMLYTLAHTLKTLSGMPVAKTKGTRALALQVAEQICKKWPLSEVDKGPFVREMRDIGNAATAPARLKQDMVRLVRFTGEPWTPEAPEAPQAHGSSTPVNIRIAAQRL
ncbi:MAG: hypothetical protein WAO98_05045 [Alphaproteobacteria bacterium]